MGSLTKIVQVFFLSPLYISPFATEFCGTFKPESTRKKISCFPKEFTGLFTSVLWHKNGEENPTRL